MEVYFASVPSGEDIFTYWQNFFFSPDVVCCVNLKYIGANGYVHTQTGAIIQQNANNPTVTYAEGCDTYTGIPRYPQQTNYKYNNVLAQRYTGSLWDISLNFPEIPLLYSDFGDSVEISIETKFWFPEGAAAQRPFGYVNPPASFGSDDIFATILNFNSQIHVTSDIFQSNSKFTLNDLWNNDYNLFSEILRYCKINRIGVFVDDIGKKIVFKRLTSFFSNYTIDDWSKKIDMSKDFIIKPITFENKYVLFNYSDSDTKLGKLYKEKYSVNFGEYKVVTDYNFNSEITKLFDEIPQSITNTDNVLSWVNLNNNHKIVYSFPSEVYVYCKDDDNKYVDVFGTFYFHNGTMAFSNDVSLNLPQVYISDDTQFQTYNNTYFYSKDVSEYVTSASTYPKLDIVLGDNMCVFNIPKENYTYLNNYSGKKSIYNNFWENYINERYNIQNKLITCYVDISPIDYNNFEFNHFVKIGNQLCMVNKIYDYDVTSSETTKVDLITIQDINGYTNNNYTA